MCGQMRPDWTTRRHEVAAHARVLAARIINDKMYAGDAWVDTAFTPLRDAIVNYRGERFFSALPREAAAMVLLIIAEEAEHG